MDWVAVVVCAVCCVIEWGRAGDAECCVYVWVLLKVLMGLLQCGSFVCWIVIACSVTDAMRC